VSVAAGTSAPPPNTLCSNMPSVPQEKAGKSARRPRSSTVLTVAALALAASVAGVSLYLWGWRDGGNERARAFAYASVVSFDRKWTLEDATKVAPGLWRATYRQSDGSTSCVLIDLSRFARIGGALPLGFAGAEPVHC
jgi:hypothetical protein